MNIGIQMQMAPPQSLSPEILIPVFNAYESVKRCVHSVLRYTPIDCPIRILDDASTDLRLLAWLDELELKEPRVRLERADENLGFVGNVNRGLATAQGDVIVLNSDTLVTPSWVERLVECAASDPQIGIVCPLSNNATILSVPLMNGDNPIPDGLTVDRFAALIAAHSARRYPRLPVAVGFCMLIRRAVIDRLGLLHRAYHRGYGEECDYSLRAWEAGFAVACCDEAFVYHQSEQSFGAVLGMTEIKQRNEAVLLSRWPFYHHLIRRFCQLNPLRDVQERILTGLAEARGDRAPHVLYVIHAYHSLGGTELHSRALMEGLADEYRMTLVFPDETDPYRDLQCIEEDGRLRVLAYQRALIEGGPRLFGQVMSLRNPAVESSLARLIAGGAIKLVHFQHLLGWGSLELPVIARRLGAAVVLSLHDYFLFCPVFDMLRPKGEPCGRPCVDPDDPGCLDCLRQQASIDEDEWRPFLHARRQGLLAIFEAADAIIAPSRFVLQRFIRAYGEALASKVRFIPHGLPDLGSPLPPKRAQRFRIGVFANLTRRKGAERLLETLALLQRRRDLEVLHFGGVEPVYKDALVAAGVGLRGVYRHQDLRRLVAEVDLALVPSVYEETFCLTIAELQALGVPVLTFAVGAIPERIADGITGFLVDEPSAKALAARIEELIAIPELVQQVRASLRQQRYRRLDENRQDYAALYEQLLGEVAGRPSVPLERVIAELEEQGAIVEMSAALPESFMPGWWIRREGHLRKGPLAKTSVPSLSPAAYGSGEERRWIVLVGGEESPCGLQRQTSAGLDLLLVILEVEEDPDALARTLDSLRTGWAGRLRILIISPPVSASAEGREGTQPAAYIEPSSSQTFSSQRAGRDLACTWLRLSPRQSAVRLINRWIAAQTGDWIGWMKAGDQLHPSALYLIADWSNRHPHWQFIYTDEDRIAEDGRRYQLCFKPDFDLDLLRSQAYLGDLCLIRREVFLTCAGLTPALEVAQLDLCLKVVDAYGEAAIGHIPQVLYHRADWRPYRPPDFESISKVIASHFKRRALRALIRPTSFAGIYWVDYPRNPKNQTALVILTCGDTQAVADLIQSVQPSIDAKEVLVLDFKRQGSAGRPRWPDPHCRWQGAEGPLARSLNRAIRRLRSERVLVMHDGLRARPNSALSILLGLIDRPEVALVGPCLLDPQGRILQAYPLLGFWPLGALGQVHRGHSLAETGGPLNRHLCVQRCATVSDQAFMLWRPAFLQAGGFAEENFANAWWLLDLGLRLGQLGYRALWAPHATLFASATGSFQGYRRRLLKDLRIAEETARLYGRWLPQLARDPAYHPHLSLRRFDARPETEIRLSWDPERCLLPRFLGFPGDLTASGHYRVIDPLSALHTHGLACVTWIDPDPGIRPPSVVELERLQPDVLLLHNALHDRHLQALELYRHYNRARLVFTLDDLITDLPPWNPFRQTNYPDLDRRLTRALGLCDRLLVSTPLLAEFYGSRHADIRVVPNRLTRTRWQGLADLAESMREFGCRPRIGWAGAGQHLGDLEWLLPVVEALAREADWCFFGMCPDELRPYAAQVLPMVDFADYPKTLARLGLDVAIAPLALHDFNRCKSPLKILEYGALGLPVICTDIEPYREAPVERLPNQPDLWIEALRARLADRESARQEGRRLRHWVESGWMLEDSLETWIEGLSFLGNKPPDTFSSAQGGE
ncbi:glycosyltransferase [Caldichromatium japonicum]|uniref:Glycosyltransferase n=1 Tax=Caldichromatium japonicum TaxID=2699430 RepID=A0A6G7VG63_9GAMM|nr:glycosyltransferase [Caldichromatium japonicum]QIK38855.1 glycosyltransferase [Caldichromatium japonicum]